MDCLDCKYFNSFRDKLEDELEDDEYGDCLLNDKIIAGADCICDKHERKWGE
jgi:hypothetical protein